MVFLGVGRQLCQPALSATHQNSPDLCEPFERKSSCSTRPPTPTRSKSMTFDIWDAGCFGRSIVYWNSTRTKHLWNLLSCAQTSECATEFDSQPSCCSYHSAVCWRLPALACFCVSFPLSICVLVNKMDKSNTLESSPAAKTEVDDLMGSENMLALDDMLESLSDDVLESSLYSEIFDTVLWGGRKYFLNFISIISGMFGSRGKERVNNRKPKTERDSGHEYWCDSCHAVFSATSPLQLFTHQNLITIAIVDLLKSSNLNHYLNV